MKRTLLTLFCALAIHSVLGQTTNRTVLPPGFENQPGNSYEMIFGAGDRTYQQLFRSSTFPSAGPIEINEIAFRVGSELSSLSAVIPHVEIRFATSSRPPEQMSQFWNENSGPNETVVFSRDNVPLFASGNQLVNPFDIRFKLDGPFVFDPNVGSLAMRFFAAGSAGDLETIDANGYGSLGVTVPVASFSQGTLSPAALGIISEFSWKPIPEPDVLSLAFVGLGAVVLSMISVKTRK